MQKSGPNTLTLDGNRTRVRSHHQLMHAGYCQFMRVHEGFCDPHFPLTRFSFLKFSSLSGGELKLQALSPNEIKDLLLDFDL